MNLEPDKRLESQIHRALRELPERPAPPSLIPNVRAALEAREARHWWQQPWLNWPRALQAASLACALALLAGIALASNSVPALLGSLRGSAGEWLGLDGWLGGTAAGLGNQLLAGPYLIYTVALLGGLYLACIVLGSTFYRFILQPVRR